MALTFAQKIADRSGSPYFAVTIESVGDVNGLRVFTNKRIRRFTAPATFTGKLARKPSIAPEIQNPLGGISEQSAITVVLLDKNDEVTSHFRTEARARTRLSADVEPGDLEVTLDSLTGIVVGSVLHIGREAMRVISVVAGTTLEVERGFLGTEAQRHLSGRPVYLNTQSLIGRRITVKLGFDDEGCDETTSQEIGTGWSIDGISLDDGLNTWRIRGRSRLKYIDRLLMRIAYRGIVQEAYTDPSHFNAQGIDARTGATQPNRHFNDRVFIEIGGNERILADLVNTPSGDQNQHIVAAQRGVGGTRAEQWRDGDEARQVFVADPAGGFGSYRYQAPNDETLDRAAADWTAVDHPAPIMLSLITGHSSVHKTLPDNWVLGQGNYSGLPAGVGLGVPITAVDVDSFLDVWYRTQNFRMPHFVVREPAVGRKVIDEQICRLCGYDLRVTDSKITLSYFRSPLEGEAITTWDASKILVEEGDDGNRMPMIAVSFDSDITAGAIVFKARTSLGAETESTFTDASFPEFFGDADGYYEAEDHHIEIDASAVRIDASGSEPEILKQRALQILYRFRRPLMRIEVVTDLSQQNVLPGQLLYLTHEQIPDLTTGVRGVTNLICRVLEKGEPEVGEDFVGIRWVLIAYGAGGRFGRVTPAAGISGAASSVGGGNYDVPVHANRYTDPNARGGLPTNDALGFRVGDRVRLKTRGCMPIVTVPAYQTVVARSANNVRLDGNFGGHASLASGTVLAFVNANVSTAQQLARYVHLADRANRTVGSGTQTPWTYGEP